MTKLPCEHPTLAIEQYQNLVAAFGMNSRQVKEFMSSVSRFDSSEVTDEIYKRAIAGFISVSE